MPGQVKKQDDQFDNSLGALERRWKQLTGGSDEDLEEKRKERVSKRGGVMSKSFKETP